ncbi:hypothetical protein Pelo_8995 [Pelomyxa schiedti]|nr:hypothetical protein Pelo_8995 [Pelomyxa schiedti]
MCSFLNAEEQARKTRAPGEGAAEETLTMQIVGCLLEFGPTVGGIRVHDNTIFECMGKCPDEQLVKKMLKLAGHTKVPMHWLAKNMALIDSTISLGVVIDPKADTDLANPDRHNEKILHLRWTAAANAILDTVKVCFWDSIADCLSKDQGVILTFLRKKVGFPEIISKVLELETFTKSHYIGSWATAYIEKAISDLEADGRYERITEAIVKRVLCQLLSINKTDFFNYLVEMFPVKTNWSFLGACHNIKMFEVVTSHDQALFRAILNLLTADERSEIDWEDMFFETKDLEGANIILSESGILPTDKKVRKFIKKCVESVDGKDTPAGLKCVTFRKWFVSAVTSGTGTIGGFLYGHQNHLPPLDFALAVEDLELTRMLLAAGASDLNYAIKHHNLELVKILAHKKSVWLPGQAGDYLGFKGSCFDAKLALFCSKLPEHIWYEMAEKRRPNCPGPSNKEISGRNWELSQLLTQIPNIDPFNCCGHLCGVTLGYVARSEELSKALFPKVPGPIIFGFVLPAVLEAVRNNNITFLTAVAEASGPVKFRQYIEALPIVPKKLTPEMVSFFATRGCCPSFSAAPKASSTSTSATAEPESDNCLEKYFEKLPKVREISLQLPDWNPSDINNKSGAESSGCSDTESKSKPAPQHQSASGAGSDSSSSE